MREHLGAKTFKRKTFGREMRCSALFAIIFLPFFKNFMKHHFYKNFIFATVLVSVLIFSNFLITESNKRTNQVMYTYKNVVGKTSAKSR